MAEPNAEDAKLAALFQKYLDEEFKRHPSFATAMGNHDYDDRMDDLSPKARADEEKRLRYAILDFDGGVNKSKLSRDGQIDQEIIHNALTLQLWQIEEDNRFENDPRIYGEYHTDSVYALFTQSTLPRERNVSNAAKRIAYIPKIIEAAKASLKNPAKVLTEIAIKRTQGAIAFYEKDIYALAQETAATSDLRVPCKAAVTALKDFAAFLETDLLPRSNGNWRLGKVKFREKLALETNAGMTANDVLQAAEEEADRVEKEMYVIAKQLWVKHYPKYTLPPDDAGGRHDTVASVFKALAEDRGTSETLLADTKQTVERIRTFIREKKILTLPEPDRCQVIEMPEFQRGFSVAYLNPAPPFDPKASSYYAVSPPPSDWPAERQTAFFKEYNRALLQVLTIHEGYPGHYVQLEYSNRHPSLIRKVFSSGVFAEGWAVYTEQMMLDEGYGDGDLALRMQQLKFYLRAVINAILDNKMHCENMSDEDAKKLLMGRGFQTEGEAVGKILRAKQSSCQLSTYFVGRTAFYRLRQNVQRDNIAFNLAAFHESVLSNGTLPVKYLPELVK